MHIAYSSLSIAFTCMLLTLVFLVLTLAFLLLLHSECVCGLGISCILLTVMYFTYSSVSSTHSSLSYCSYMVSVYVLTTVAIPYTRAFGLLLTLMSYLL